MHRPSDEFWNARPSQIMYCVKRFTEMINRTTGNSENYANNEVQTITSMREIAGWGDKA